ncbi:MAG: glutamate synthase subunit beta [Planctomycetota bacterium]
MPPVATTDEATAAPAYPAAAPGLAVQPAPLPKRDVGLRLNDWYEVYPSPSPDVVQSEAERCMACGTAYCQPSSGYGQGCPIDNKIPEWNKLAAAGRWRDAYNRLRLTNNFPEFTSRLCPAPCQDACIHQLNGPPVAIKCIERAISDTAYQRGWTHPNPPSRRTGKRVAIIGSGPSGLTVADQLNHLGHAVTVYERDDRPGGLLTYGVPNMKLDKGVVQRRLDIMAAEGVRFRCNAHVGINLDPQVLQSEYDAVVLACGALKPRDVNLPGRELNGITQAMPYLSAATRHYLDGTPLPEPALDAAGKDVVVIGGGDTGADCIATALRQGCRSLLNITRRDTPPDHRDDSHPWPGPTGAFMTDYAHAEGAARFGDDPRRFNINPVAFIGGTNGNGQHVQAVLVDRTDPATGTTDRVELPAQRVILAIGFTGSDSTVLYDTFNVDPANPAAAEPRGVFTTGDMRRGPSLVVWAIREGRLAAERVHQRLTRSGVS